MKEEQLILRDKLAIDRTKLANQRTLLAYIKTGIYFISSALGIFYLEGKSTFGWLEWILSFIGLLSMGVGLMVYARMKRKIKRLYN